jgi:hypothetical protein
MSEEDDVLFRELCRTNTPHIEQSYRMVARSAISAARSALSIAQTKERIDQSRQRVLQSWMLLNKTRSAQ